MKAPDLRKMVGPLPLGAWVVVVLVGVGLALAARRRQIAEGDTPPVAEPAVVEPGYPTTTGVGTIPVGGSTPIDSSGRPSTNAEWVVYATRILVGLNRPQGAFAISQALAKYVSVNTSSITAAERSIIEDALRHAGLPPEGVGPVGVTNPPTAPPPSTPGAYTLQWTVVRPGESANAIVVRLRKAGRKTYDGRPLTAAYLLRMNQWSGTASQRRWTGTPVKY
jgi:hypothetical protein